MTHTEDPPDGISPSPNVWVEARSIDSGARPPQGPLIGRPGRLTDMPFLLRQEERPEVVSLVPPWPKDRHWRAMSDPDHQYILFQDAEERVVGYVVLGGLTNGDGCLELVRMVAAPPGFGTGTAMARAVLAHAFGPLGAHRVGLSLFSDNACARRLFANVGFVLEGKLRDAVRGPRGYRSLTLMGMLRRDYQAGL